MPNFKIARNEKFAPGQLTVEWCGQRVKHCVLSLREGQNIETALKTPALWAGIQSDRAKALRKGDTITIIAADGSVIADSAMATDAGAGVYFSKPLRMVTLVQAVLFETGAYRVVPEGSGFAIASKRDSTVERSIIYPSVEAAKLEIIRREPVKVA